MTPEERLAKAKHRFVRGQYVNGCLVAGTSLYLMLCIFLASGGWFVLKTSGPQIARTTSGAEEVRAKVFYLDDKSGKTRAVLCVAGGLTKLELCDENAQARVILSLDENNEAKLVFCQKNGTPRVMLGLSHEEEPFLTLLDRSGEQHAALLVSKDGPTLCLNDENNKRIWKAP